jgi:antirestriction protein ArdC
MTTTENKITTLIIDELKKGNCIWRKDWSGISMPANYTTGKEYNGINTLLLTLNQWRSSYFLTFNQAKKAGGHIKKGEKATPIIKYDVYFKHKQTGHTVMYDKLIKYPKDEQKNYKRLSFLKYFYIFNYDQTENLPNKDKDIKKIDFKPLKKAQSIVNTYLNKQNIKLQHQTQRAYYNPASDYINMPKPDTFTSKSAYYATLFHELTHSTGHKKRLDRGLQKNSMYKQEYSKEELVAELGSAFLSSKARINNKDSLKNNVGYIKSWLKFLQNDPSYIISGAAKASRATNYIINS